MYKIAPKTPLACRPHDHAHCVASALADADALCARQGVRLTELRRRVLELVWASHKPLGAYDILAVLSEEDGRKAAPPTVYRALDFLLENGFIHKLASINAFVSCHHPNEAHQVPFLICDVCSAAIEVCDERVSRLLSLQAKEHGFRPSGQTLEVHGTCADCAAS